MPEKKFMWCTLVHLGTNLWFEEGNHRGEQELKLWKMPASPRVRFDPEQWEKYLVLLKETGTNTIILDLAEGLQYKSHPELAIEGSWGREKMTAELAKMRSMGFDVIPKLNFSATHDVWLGKYARMVSTEEYYRVCKDLIDEVAEIFKPEYIHIGMDEEDYETQKLYDYVVIRQNDLWWHDLYYFVDCVEKHGARAIMWSYYARSNPDEFIEKCPKSVIQSVWYYLYEFEGDISPENEEKVRPFKLLSEAGFDLMPTGSIEFVNDNLEMMAAFCKKHIAPERLVGFMQTTWESVEPQWEDYLVRGAKSLREARRIYEGDI